MTYVIDAPAVSSAAVAGTTDRFPVRRIFCVGRNYADHAREMGKDPDREPPFFFSKPADTIIGDESTISYPRETTNLHYEAELVVAIGRGGASIPEGSALDHVWGYAVGNDLTRRDLQLQAREMGRPWDMGKGFDRSAVVGPLHAVADVGHVDKGAIWLKVNGETKQDADVSHMIWSVPEIISILSRYVDLAPGDLIMTGTPAGVGPLEPGDRCEVGVQGLGSITTTIRP